MRRSVMVVASGAFLAASVLIRTPIHAATAAPDPGALVLTTMRTQVGVVLDEIPSSMRNRVTSSLVAKPSSFWVERAKTQLRLTSYRLVFRAFYYGASRQALPLPPEPLWNVRLVGTPSRIDMGGHDVVAVTYTFSSTLLTDEQSPRVSEPRLKNIGGQWSEHFVLPVDPELVMQRTGYACMDEEAFPFASVDSEEVDSFYDQDCQVNSTLTNVGQCHYTRQPTESCLAAVSNHIGAVAADVVYERLAWNARTASKYRYGDVTGPEPDLQIYTPDFEPSRTNYRYIHNDGCEVVEGSVSGTGWRRLLQFATSDENVGEGDLTIGGVDYTISGHSQPLDQHNLYEFSACHHHYHFKYYGSLSWDGSAPLSNAKKGFCLQSTARAANRETSPLHNPFGSCDYQGVSAGWVDQYKAGLSGQWLDTTELPTGQGTRSFRSNPYGLICEGTFVDGSGNPIPPGDPVVWRPTGLTADNGEAVEAPLCRLRPGWDANNVDSKVESIQPQGQGLITSPCTRGQIGPLRNCGFGDAPRTVQCVAGSTSAVTFALPAGAAPQVVRLTEYSHVLASPIPARYEDSYVPLSPGEGDQPSMLANVTVTASAPVTVPFSCPAPRSGGQPEPGGTFSVYTAPVYPDDPTATVSVL